MSGGGELGVGIGFAEVIGASWVTTGSGEVGFSGVVMMASLPFRRGRVQGADGPGGGQSALPKTGLWTSPRLMCTACWSV